MEIVVFEKNWIKIRNLNKIEMEGIAWYHKPIYEKAVGLLSEPEFQETGIYVVLPSERLMRDILFEEDRDLLLRGLCFVESEEPKKLYSVSFPEVKIHLMLDKGEIRVHNKGTANEVYLAEMQDEVELMILDISDSTFDVRDFATSRRSRIDFIIDTISGESWNVSSSDWISMMESAGLHHRNFLLPESDADRKQLVMTVFVPTKVAFGKLQKILDSEALKANFGKIMQFHVGYSSKHLVRDGAQYNDVKYEYAGLFQIDGKSPSHIVDNNDDKHGRVKIVKFITKEFRNVEYRFFFISGMLCTEGVAKRLK